VRSPGSCGKLAPGRTGTTGREAGDQGRRPPGYPYGYISWRVQRIAPGRGFRHEPHEGARTWREFRRPDRGPAGGHRRAAGRRRCRRLPVLYM